MDVISLDEFVGRYVRAVKRLERYGVRAGGPTRLGAYRRQLEAMLEAESAGVEAHQGSVDTLNLMLETSDVIAIASLPDDCLSEPTLRSKLRSIAGGPVSIIPGAQDPARDAAFEYSMAAMLDQNGHFGGFSSHGGDLTIGDQRAPLECKRVTSIASLEHRLRDGRRKLDRLHEGGQPPGIIAVDLSSAIFSELSVLAGDDGSSLAMQADARLTQRLYRFFGEEHPTLIDALRSDATVGIIIRYLGVGAAGGLENVRTQMSLHLIELHDSESEHNRMFTMLADLVHPAPIVRGTFLDIEEAVALYPLPEKFLS